MYKVFVDHKPLAFVGFNELNSHAQHIKYNDKLSLGKIRILLNEVSLDDPLQISHFDPQIAFLKFFDGYLKIPAAGGIVRNNGKYLMIQRHGLWDIPKGKIDPGENPEEACVREIAEECGIEGHRIVQPLTETYHTMKYKGRKALKHTHWYLLEHDGPLDSSPQVEEGISRAEWKSLEFMLSTRGNTFGSINDVIDAYTDQVTV